MARGGSGLVGELLVVVEVEGAGDADHEHEHRGRGHRGMRDERADEALEPAIALGLDRRDALRRPARRLLEQHRRDRLRRLELDLEDPTLSDHRAGMGQVIERRPVGRMGLEVHCQSRFISERQLAVKRADQQRVDVLCVDHGSWVLILPL